MLSAVVSPQMLILPGTLLDLSIGLNPPVGLGVGAGLFGMAWDWHGPMVSAGLPLELWLIPYATYDQPHSGEAGGRPFKLTTYLRTEIATIAADSLCFWRACGGASYYLSKMVPVGVEVGYLEYLDSGWKSAGRRVWYFGVTAGFAFGGARGGEMLTGPRTRIASARLDDDGDGVMRSSEEARLTVTIANDGDVTAGWVLLNLNGGGVLERNVGLPPVVRSGPIPAGGSRTLSVPLRAGSSIPTGRYQLTVDGRQADGDPLGSSVCMVGLRQADPPHLACEVVPTDDNGNGVFEAGELVGFRLDVSNSGQGAAYGVVALAAEAGGAVVARESLGIVNPAETRQSHLRFQMPVGVKSGEVRYKVWLEEASGFAPGEQLATVPVGAEAAVVFDVAHEIDDDASGASRGNGDGAVDKGEAVELKLSVANRGVSTARGVRVSILTNQAGIELRTPSTSLGDIPEGESRNATLVFDVKQSFAGSRVEFVLNVTEQTGRFTGGEQLAYDLGKPAEAGVGLARPQFPKRPNTYALVVGISRYQDKSVVPLAFAENDARAVAGLLKANGIENVWELYGKDATRNQMMANLASLEELAKGDSSLVLVFFSGHGSPRSLDADQRGPYLMPYDVTRGSEKALQASSVSQADVTGFLDRCGAAAALVMVNACFFTGPQGAAGVGSMEPIRLQLPKARVVLSAARWDQYAYEDSSYRHSVFTYRLLEGLRGKAEAGTGDGWVDMGELVRYVGDNVSKDVASRRRAVQTPTLTGEGNFRITRCMR